jgi:signal transduction histidine kinase
MTEAADRWFWLWDVFFAVVYLAVVSAILGYATEDTLPRRLASVALLTSIVVMYVFLGRSAILKEQFGWRLYAFVGVMFACVAGSATLTPISQFTFFAIVPLLFMSLRLRLAVIVVALTITVSMFMSLAREQAPDYRSAVIGIVISITFSVMIGVWIDRVTLQSSERAELITKLEASQSEAARLSHEAGVTAERERLAGEIHDTLAQGFTSIITLVQAAESELGRNETQVRKHLSLALRAARDNLAESRALVAALSPAELTESSVQDAIRRQAAKLTEETGVAAVFDVQGARRPLPTGVEVVLLRAVQESLSNVRKHAFAAAVEIVLSYQDSSVVLIVSDDGRGFDPSSATSGFGLRGMRSRVEQAGGTLSVTSSPGAGTTVELEVCT